VPPEFTDKGAGVHRGVVLSIAVLIVTFGLTLPSSSTAQSAHTMSVTPNPAAANGPIVVRNDAGTANQCSPPGVVDGAVSQGDAVVTTFSADPDESGNWSADISGLPAGTYVVSAACLTQPTDVCDDGSVVSGGACEVCPDGSTAAPGNCPPPTETCGDGAVVPVGTCEVCPDSSTAAPGNCPPPNATSEATTQAAPATAPAGSAAPEGAPGAAFEYAPVTLTVTGGIVSGSPSFTG
jgi:hypothetical protein